MLEQRLVQRSGKLCPSFDGDRNFGSIMYARVLTEQCAARPARLADVRDADEQLVGVGTNLKVTTTTSCSSARPWPS